VDGRQKKKKKKKKKQDRDATRRDPVAVFDGEGRRTAQPESVGQIDCDHL
jgi:hypothetical protein